MEGFIMLEKFIGVIVFVAAGALTYAGCRAATGRG